MASLDLLDVPSSKGVSVPLSALVQEVEDTGPASITRLERRPLLTLYANLATGAAQSEVPGPLPPTLLSDTGRLLLVR